jgi:hypothetical protein
VTCWHRSIQGTRRLGNFIVSLEPLAVDGPCHKLLVAAAWQVAADKRDHTFCHRAVTFVALPAGAAFLP